MSETEPGFQSFEAAADARNSEFPTELWSLLKTISTQIDEADQRHTGLLQELRDRLAALSQEAEDVRTSVPQEAAPAYERIETGLAQLAQRIDALDDSEQGVGAAAPAPVVLRSATDGFSPAGGETRTSTASGIDHFDVVGDDDGDAGGWDASDAEALTRIYEESDAALVRTSPRGAETAPVATIDDVQAVAPSMAGFSATMAADPSPASVGIDREWLDQRLSEIAFRIEQSLAEMNPNLTVDHLGVRFDAFEERMGSVLGDVATRTDVESLRHLEDQLQELASHLEQTERQLGRLDGIEQQLQAVIEHISADFGGQSIGVTDVATPDFKSLASATAEEVALRFASTMEAAGQDQRIEELGSLLRSMIHDRRQSDEQTYTMLDTVQQAMIRLLDRIDAIEMSHVTAQPNISTAPDHAADATMPAAGGADFVQDFGAPEHDEAAPHFSATPYRAMAELQAAPAPAAAGPTSSVATSAVDRLRQDFIADAQRAKMRAAASVDPASEAAVSPQSTTNVERAVRGAPRGKVASVAAGTELLAGSRKQRLTALALCLVIAVSGSALFFKSRTKAPDTVEPAAMTETLTPPAAPAPDSAARAGADAPAQSEEIDVPAAPKAPAPETTTDAGAGFEVPADQASPVPAPIPAPSAAAPSQSGAVGGPLTNENALGSEGETSTGGEVIEHHRDLERGPAGQSLTPQGIILQNGERKPTALEYAQLQAQQNVATLSSRLGANASRLSAADLMPEEVAKFSVTPIAATSGDVTQFKVQPASLSVAAMPGRNVDVPVTNGSMSSSHAALPPATVGPMSLRLAAANGDPSAAFEVGARLAEGKGTQQNFAEAIIWYQKSAAQGFAQAQYRLGTLYERGLGVKADNARAQMWYQRAAEQGHVKAMHNLAVLSAGRSTGSPDYAMAARWFEAAADYGLPDSQYNLAVLYENGLGVPKDAMQAFKWYALAGRGGDAEALRRRDTLKTHLTPDQRLNAENAVSAFTPKKIVPIVNDARVAGEDWKKRQAS